MEWIRRLLVAVRRRRRDHQRMKHIDILYNFILEKIQEGVSRIIYKPTSEQVADIFTKALARGPFEGLQNKLGLFGWTEAVSNISRLIWIVACSRLRHFQIKLFLFYHRFYPIKTCSRVGLPILLVLKVFMQFKMVERVITISVWSNSRLSTSGWTNILSTENLPRFPTLIHTLNHTHTHTYPDQTLQLL